MYEKLAPVDRLLVASMDAPVQAIKRLTEVDELLAESESSTAPWPVGVSLDLGRKAVERYALSGGAWNLILLRKFTQMNPETRSAWQGSK
jgi:hypothetical protein